jgi:hypothetical protein
MELETIPRDNVAIIQLDADIFRLKKMLHKGMQAMDDHLLQKIGMRFDLDNMLSCRAANRHSADASNRQLADSTWT